MVSFRDLKIRNKLLLGYSILIITTILTGSTVIYYLVRDSIETSTQAQLENSAEAVKNMVRTAATTAIKTHLRSISEIKMKQVAYFYSLQKAGILTESEAKARAGAMLLSDKIGKTGYMFVWDIRLAPEVIPLAVHPYIQGKDVAYVDFVQAGAKMKEGYIEYEWKNPQEKTERKKSMFLAYFEPWQWVVAAASYREEFLDQVDIEDFKDFIAPLRFGKSGYPFVLDLTGNIIYHPKLQGNYMDKTDADGFPFIREICTRKSGTITYRWKNPDERRARKKLAVYRYIPEYNWVVATSSYYEEFQEPLDRLRNLMVLIVLVTVLLSLPLSLWLGAIIARPIKLLIERFSRGIAGDFTARLEVESADEAGSLAGYFNNFMEQLEKYRDSLKKEILAKEMTTRDLEIFRKFSDASGQGIFMTDMEGRVTYMNPSMLAILEVGLNETILGERIHRFYEELFIATLDSVVFPQLKLHETWTGELNLISGKGTVKTVLQNIFLIRGSDGRATHFANVVTDISEIRETEQIIERQKEHIQTQYEEMEEINLELNRIHERLIQSHVELSEEKERLSTTLRAIGEGVIATDRDGRIGLMNNAAEEIIGITRDMALGKRLDQVATIVNELNGKTYEDPAALAVRTGTMHQLPGNPVLVTAEGWHKYILASASPLFDKEGSIYGAVLVLNDITERRNMEKELMKTLKIESLGLFAGGIAHDFNNLLTAIMGNISLALQYLEENEELHRILQDAQGAAVSAKDLTQQLLTFSKGGDPVKQVASIKDIVITAAEFILSGSTVQCEYAIPDDLWNAPIDTGQFNQVVYNIILNARQAMPEGGKIRISAENFPYDGAGTLPLDAGKYIKLTMEDEGPGIPEEHLKNIFDPYFTTKSQGSGLGLTITYSIVKKHGGHITVETGMDRGTTFMIYLPATTETDQKTAGARRHDRFGKGAILLMDDEESVITVAGKMLRRLGFEIAAARNGAEAVAMYREASERGTPYRAVIMDLTVPGGMGGKQAMELLREYDPQVVAFVSSGYSNDPVMANYAAHGFTGVIAKPYLFEELSDLLFRHLGADSCDSGAGSR